MAQEEVTYTIPNDMAATGGNDGSKVDVVFTYDPNAANPDGSFTVTNASGTYQTLDANGQVVNTDTITGIVAPGTTLQVQRGGTVTPDDELFIVANPKTSAIVTAFKGVGFKINNAADSNDGKGNVVFENAQNSQTSPAYAQDGLNRNNAVNVTETAVACFASGTLIRTSRGDVPVEELSVGDLVVAASGQPRPIRWLGHRTIDCRAHPRAFDILPVRVAAQACPCAIFSCHLAIPSSSAPTRTVRAVRAATSCRSCASSTGRPYTV